MEGSHTSKKTLRWYFESYNNYHLSESRAVNVSSSVMDENYYIDLGLDCHVSNCFLGLFLA
jgi:hypothetical protein